jgi:ketosteroid isomerase-like protein/quinol monooxygenase YgiN
MIVEYIRYRVPGDQAAAVVDAYARAAGALEASPHCLRYDVGTCVEDPGAVVVRIEWDSVEGHLAGFRRDAVFRDFLQAVSPFIGAIEEMRHYDLKVPRVESARTANQDRAAANAAADPRAVVERFLEANHVLDVDGMFREIGEDAVWSFPAAPPGAPREVEGKATNRAFFESLLPMWTSFSLPRREVHALEDDPERVVAYYASSGTLVDGSAYTNTYLSLVTVRGGKIVHWIEFCDAEPLARGVGILMQARGA